ncbi:helix-turn-helix transcriptional regulator [Lacrimispora sp.]|uniref:helix-turn-helix transcriptional regulator n=1 Tax=Lacrimispora sp. TaxID=2719234 RepID=UPI0029E628F9|nr:putative molybdopterin biosynthesis protein [Lacrimispora sp.]
MEKIYRPQEVADQLKIKKATVYELIKRGELKSSKVGKQIRISQEQLDEYLTRTIPAGQDSGLTAALPPVMDIPRFHADQASRQVDYLLHSNGLIISSQESRVVELLRSLLTRRVNSLPLLHSYMNDYNSLYSLYYGKTHMALTCLCYQQFGERIRQISHFLPGTEAAVIHLCTLKTGFYVQKGNPKKIKNVTDLCRPDIVFLNREKGNGLRMSLDRLLAEQKTDRSFNPDSRDESLSHMSSANAVASGLCDISMGDLSHLTAYPQLDFIPFNDASMDLVIVKASLEEPAFSAILETINSREFKDSLLHFNGYETMHTGDLLFTTP